MSELTYKGYVADIEFSPEDGCFFGKLANIRDLVNFEADNANDLILAFQEAVDDYLDDCKEEGRQPNIPFKGVFNVRTSTDVHRDLALIARKRGVKLNAIVVEAIQEKISSSGLVIHKVTAK